MAVNLKKMQQKYDESKTQGDFFKFSPGKTSIYIHPPCRGDSDKYEPTVGLNYIPVVVHFFEVNGKRQMVICLDQADNPILLHPFIIKLLKKRGIVLKNGCPICRGLARDEIPSGVKGNIMAQTRFLWGLTPFELEAKKVKTKLPIEPTSMYMGKQLYNGIMGVFEEAGDVTDPGEAVLVKVDRKGTSLNDTRYNVFADIKTAQNPLNLMKTKIWPKVKKAMAVGGIADLFNIVASQIKTQPEIKALLSGVELEESDENAEGTEEEYTYEDENGEGGEEGTEEEYTYEDENGEGEEEYTYEDENGEGGEEDTEEEYTYEDENGEGEEEEYTYEDENGEGGEEDTEEEYVYVDENGEEYTYEDENGEGGEEGTEEEYTYEDENGEGGEEDTEEEYTYEDESGEGEEEEYTYEDENGDGGEEGYSDGGEWDGDGDDFGIDEQALDDLDRKIQAVGKKKSESKTGTRKVPAKKPAGKKAVAKKTPAKKTVAKKTPANKIPAKTGTRKVPAKRPAGTKIIAKKTPANKIPAKTGTRKVPAKKTVAKKTPANKIPAKTGTRKVPAKRPAGRVQSKKRK